MPTNPAPRRMALLAAATSLLMALLMAPGCGGGGGGGSGSFDQQAQLLAITFPDPNDVNVEPEELPPFDAPLVQQLVLTFSGNPDPNRVSSTTISIRDAAGLPVAGRYVVAGPVVTFTPTLPIRPLVVSGDGAIDPGGTGLEPRSTYTLRIGPSSFSFVASVAPALRARFPDPVDPGGIALAFRTTLDTAKFFAGLPIGAPQLVSADPADGATGISPNLYSDPGGQFPPRRDFTLVFDRALLPDAGNVSDATFTLVDLDDRPGGFPFGLPLGVDVTLVENEVDRSVVSLSASGILPFGHLLAIERPNDLKSLSDSGAPTGATTIATSFTIAAAPAATIRDALVEDFDTTERRETAVDQFGTGNLPADWDLRDSGILQAAFTFQGDGVLGRFIVPPPASGDTKVVTLDTSRQVFPLADGSTPDAPPGYEVVGGVFSFTDIDLPSGVVLAVVGGNPLVLTATGATRIAGQIFIAGGDGTADHAYDSAVTSVPGGQGIAGGGRGGEGHPILFFPPDQVSYLTLVDPTFGGSGYGIDPVDGVMKRIGGTGGECGCLDEPDAKGDYSTNQEFTDCNEFRPPHSNEKVPGGGGGSMFRKGDAPLDHAGRPIYGIGNVRPDGTGTYTVSDNRSLSSGSGGRAPFSADGNSDNDFYGTKGQLTRLIGGQGGGGGASLTESYYCGDWCKLDPDPVNDHCCCEKVVCDPFVLSHTRAPSVGDARGGGAGGGGGAVLIQVLGDLTLDPTALISARGGNGMGGEALGCSYWGGGGGGGAGGMVILQSATNILIKSGAVIDVSRGSGDSASDSNAYFGCDEGDTDGNTWAIGDGGLGGHGMIQLQVPAGQTAVVVNPTNSLLPTNSWIDSTNTLNPAEFTPTSLALSTWYDLGRATQRPPALTNPVFSFGGLDSQGFVVTDANGNVVSPSTTDIVCGYLGQIDPLTRQYRKGEEPRADFIPTNARIRVQFQGADPIVPGSKEIDVATIVPSPTTWAASPAIANGRQFLRWRVTLDVTADGSSLETTTRLPMVQSVAVQADF